MRRLQVGYEPGRIALGGDPRRAVVQGYDSRGMLVHGDLLRQRALADLAGAEQHDHACVFQRLQYVRTEMTL